MTSAAQDIGIDDLFNDLGRKYIDPGYTGLDKDDNNDNIEIKNNKAKDKDDKENEKKSNDENKDEENNRGVKLDAKKSKKQKSKKFC